MLGVRGGGGGVQAWREVRGGGGENISKRPSLPHSHKSSLSVLQASTKQSKL